MDFYERWGRPIPYVVIDKNGDVLVQGDAGFNYYSKVIKRPAKWGIKRRKKKDKKKWYWEFEEKYVDLYKRPNKNR